MLPASSVTWAKNSPEQMSIKPKLGRGLGGIGETIMMSPVKEQHSPEIEPEERKAENKF